MCHILQLRKDAYMRGSNPRPKYMTREGLEPPTSRFGISRANQLHQSRWPAPLLWVPGRRGGSPGGTAPRLAAPGIPANAQQRYKTDLQGFAHIPGALHKRLGCWTKEAQVAAGHDHGHNRAAAKLHAKQGTREACIPTAVHRRVLRSRAAAARQLQNEQGGQLGGAGCGRRRRQHPCRGASLVGLLAGVEPVRVEIHRLCVLPRVMCVCECAMAAGFPTSMASGAAAGSTSRRPART